MMERQPSAVIPSRPRACRGPASTGRDCRWTRLLDRRATFLFGPALAARLSSLRSDSKQVARYEVMGAVRKQEFSVETASGKRALLSIGYSGGSTRTAPTQSIECDGRDLSDRARLEHRPGTGLRLHIEERAVSPGDDAQWFLEARFSWISALRRAADTCGSQHPAGSQTVTPALDGTMDGERIFAVRGGSARSRRTGLDPLGRRRGDPYGRRYADCRTTGRL